MPAHSNTPNTFWSRVDCTSPNDCWLWQGGSAGNEYGAISWNGRPTMVHRLAWELTYGPIPHGLVVRHRCDTPRCCNPDHLLLGTQLDNVADRVARNRSRRMLGESNNSAKLTTAAVCFIREQYAAKNMTGRALAKMFNVSTSQITRIVCGKAWMPLPPE